MVNIRVNFQCCYYICYHQYDLFVLVNNHDDIKKLNYGNDIGVSKISLIIDIDFLAEYGFTSATPSISMVKHGMYKLLLQ